MRRLTRGRTPSSRLGQLCAVEETLKPKTPPFVAKQKAVVRLKHSSKTNPRWLLDRTTNTENGNKENEPTRRRIYNRTTPREKAGLVQLQILQIHALFSTGGTMSGKP
jgi:hypothetical protein